MTEQKVSGLKLSQSSDERQRRFIPQKYGGNYLALVIGLLIFFILVAAFSSYSEDSIQNRILAVLFYFTLIVGFRGTTRKFERNLIFGFAVLVGLVLTLSSTSLAFTRLDQASIALQGLLGAFLMVLVLRDILLDDRVTIDTIFGSIAAYILFAMFWASVYVTIERGNPGAFKIPDPSGSSLADLLYFSFVTQTTLGYGDITPVGPVTRQFAGVQAMAGQLYVAILVAWLVGVGTAQYLKRKAREDDVEH